MAPESLVPGVQVALSAKTVLTHFQSLGYALVEFRQVGVFIFLTKDTLSS